VILTLSSLVLVLAMPPPWSPGLSLTVRLFLSGLFLEGLLGLVASVLLVRRYRWAPRWVIAWLLLNLTIAIGSSFFGTSSPTFFPIFCSALSGSAILLSPEESKPPMAKRRRSETPISLSRRIQREGTTRTRRPAAARWSSYAISETLGGKLC
jgi:hypothetical protein